MSELVLYEKRDRVAIVTYNRPEALNAYNLEMLRQLEKVWLDIRADPDVWVVIVTGAGDKAFCAGADVTSLSGTYVKGVQRFDHDLDIGKPTIAAVNGYAISGGFTAVLSCDLAIAAQHARFGLKQVTVGVIPDAGSGLLPRAIPRKLAMELLLTARVLDADEALTFGLVNKVVPKEQLMPEALAMAAVICANGPLAVRATRDVARRTLEVPFSQSQAIGYDHLTRLLDSEDAREGAAAFKERRRPEWQAR